MNLPGWARPLAETLAWAVAGAWAVRVSDLVRNLGTVEDLSQIEWSHAPHDGPSLTVVVPARDEAANVAATLDALMAADYRALQVIAVDDRSTDATGEILDDYAVRWPERLRVIHVEELADGWLGKTYAMQLALERSSSDYMLFTDADVLFSPSVLRRAVAYAEKEQLAHLVVMPTFQVRSHGEGIVLGFFQILAMWATRPWRIMDPRSKRDTIGVGAFNMVRRETWLALGGFEPQRMVVLEDVHVGLRFKAAGLAQRMAYAPEMVQVHWARGMRGLIGVMTKNLFSGTNFNPLVVLVVCGWIIGFCVLPLAGLAWWPTLAPALIVALAVAAAYRRMGAYSRIDARYGWLMPLGALVIVWVMLRSMMTAFLIGGVRWRGTKYRLQELRRANHPRQWERAAAERRRLERLRRE